MRGYYEKGKTLARGKKARTNLMWLLTKKSRLEQCHLLILGTSLEASVIP